jgi:iron complex outermembrane receptor protein
MIFVGSRESNAETSLENEDNQHRVDFSIPYVSYIWRDWFMKIRAKMLLASSCFSIVGGTTGLALAQSASAVATTSASDSTIEEITVTSRKREELLQSVPIAVTALTPQIFEKQQIMTATDLDGAIPNLQISKDQGSQNGAQIFLRGIGQDNSTSVDEPAVGVYLDGVYYGRAIGGLFDINDEARIEVLRGPQGTLYGRNSTGGAIRLESNRPSFDNFHMNGDISTGSFNERDFRGMVNIPVADNAAFRLAFSSLTNDGYYTNALTGQGLNRKDTQSARGTFLYEPSDTLSVFISADFSRDNSGNQIGTPFLMNANGTVSQPIYGGIFKAAPDIPDNNYFNGGGTSVQLDWDLAFGTVTSISSYRAMHYTQADDLGASPVGNDLARTLGHQQGSQGLEFKSKFDGPVNFTSGLFYFREDATEDLIFLVPLSPQSYFQTTPVTKLALPYITKQSSQSMAGYSEVTYDATDDLSFTAGGRYTYDLKDIQRHGTAGNGKGHVNFYNFSPKGNVSYHLTDSVLAYGTVSQGYKAGVYQPFPSAQTATTALPPEKVTEYEAGFKGEFLDKRLLLNAAAFDAYYSNLQIGLLAGNGTVLAASADLHVTGTEIEFTAVPVTGLTLNGQIAQQHTRFTRVPFGPADPQLTDRQKFSPEFHFRLAPDYKFEFGNGDSLDFGVVYDWTGLTYTGLPNAVFFKQPDHSLLDARLAYSKTDQGWTIEIAGKNITNTLWFNTSTELDAPAAAVRFYQPLATWMLRFSYKM